MLDLVIFDLDDTLYPEYSYVLSGFRAVASQLALEYAIPRESLYQEMVKLFHENRHSVFDRLVSRYELHSKRSSYAQSGAQNLIERMIWIYRTHAPQIKLYPDALPVLLSLRREGIRTAIITDGRAESQRAKIRALQLERHVDAVVITDELGPNRMYWKPHPYAFRLLLDRFQVKPDRACYVGDNPEKDFVGPAKLGMHTVRIIRPDGLYSSQVDPQQAAERTIQSLHQLIVIATQLW